MFDVYVKFIIIVRKNVYRIFCIKILETRVGYWRIMGIHGLCCPGNHKRQQLKYFKAFVFLTMQIHNQLVVIRLTTECYLCFIQKTIVSKKLEMTEILFFSFGRSSSQPESRSFGVGHRVLPVAQLPRHDRQEQPSRVGRRRRLPSRKKKSHLYFAGENKIIEKLSKSC